MIRSIVFEDEIRLWWEYRSGVTQGGYYEISGVNGVAVNTDKTHCRFVGLSPNTPYSFVVRLRDKNGEPLEKVGEVTIVTGKQKKKIDVTKAPYFAVGDGCKVNTVALQKAIDDCGADECVYLPDGIFATGALYLHGDMELRLADDAKLLGETDPTAYLPKVRSRYEGIEMMCYASLLNLGELDNRQGYTTKNVVIRGGEICGGGDELRKRIIEREKALTAEPLDGLSEIEKHRRAPGRQRGRLISVHNAQNVVIANVNAGNSPSWNIHMVYSDNIVTCGGRIFSHAISNGDGWDPDSSTNCVLFDVDFDTGDDCVAIKSGKNPEGNAIARPCEHVRVFDCRAEGGNGMAIGSEMSGGINDVQFWDCDVETSFAGFNIKSTPERGGYIRNVAVYHCKTSKILFRTFMTGNDDGESANQIPVLENFTFEDVVITGVETYTDNQRIDKANAVDGIGYPTQGGELKNLKLKNLRLRYRPMMPWHLVDLRYVENVEIENIICDSYMIQKYDTKKGELKK